jgi:L-fuconate dehydratase
VTRITGLETYDVRFPTSRALDGSDAMNPAPDYSAAYVVLRTDDPGLSGHGFVFTIGEGNDIEAAALRALEPHVVGQEIGELTADPGLLSRRLVADSPLRWLGPEKGVMHMAIGAVVNAGWDLVTRAAGEPLWRYLARLSPEQVVGLVDFRYLTDALTPADALAILRKAEPGKADRIAELEHDGYPAYSTSPGWLGYSADKLAALLREAAHDGFTLVKLKVGADRDADIARLELARQVVGDEMRIAVDANQVWDVPEAISWVNELARFDLTWIEEPTSPDDILGMAAIRRGVAPVPVATGEHVANRVMFKQFLQAEAIDVMQIDACRVGREREHRQPAAGREVRRAGLPARGRGGPVRGRAAPVVLRLRGRVRAPRRARDRVDRPSPRALHQPCLRRQGPLHRAAGPGELDGVQAVVGTRVPVPIRRRVGPGLRLRRETARRTAFE